MTPFENLLILLSVQPIASEAAKIQASHPLSFPSLKVKCPWNSAPRSNSFISFFKSQVCITAVFKK
jgi:hypothetical protein